MAVHLAATPPARRAHQAWVESIWSSP